MLTTLSIISIFTEIFAAGILLAGTAALLANYFGQRRLKDLFFSCVLFFLFFGVAATITSQLMFNLGRGVEELILVHKLMAASLIICAAFIWAFMIERFNLAGWRWTNALVIVFSLLIIFRLVGSQVNLIYREEIVEPLVDFAVGFSAKPFFVLMLSLLVVGAFFSGWRQKGGKRTLTFYLSGSAFCLLLSYLSSFLYLRFGDPGLLVASWGLSLVASVGLLLSELVPWESPEAKRPILFLRTRILYKLILILIMLIVILFEATTLATINIGKNALSQEIISNYETTAADIADRLASYGTPPSPAALRELVTKATGTAQATIFVVDIQGRTVAHPDNKRAIQQEALGQHEAVKALLSGKTGGGEFRDELGSVMVGAYVPVNRFGWGVVVEKPIGSAYFELRRLETNSLLFVIIGIILTALVGVFFARSIEKPIKELTLGTEAVAKGDLRWQISVDSADEIGKLAAAFNQMTKDLRDSQERLILSEKLASLGTMAAGMAHEIKNPLVSLRTFTQLLQQKWDDPEFREKFSSIIPHEIERINRIAESLLKFGKPMKPELSKVEVNSLLEEVLLLFESEAKKGNVRVTKKFAELPAVTGDAGQLQQAFVNIIKNAIESMDKNGGELVVKTDIGEVIRLGRMQRQGMKRGEEMVWGEEEELQKPIPVVFIEISDTGGGISDDHLKSLFDPFFTTKMTGTGMGLPITLRIIEEHKGSIKVRSQMGKGTTFIITLPQQA